MREHPSEIPVPLAAASPAGGEAAAAHAETVAPGGRADPWAWRSPAAWARLLGITAAGVAADLATKYAAFASVAGNPVTFTRQDVLSLGRDRLGDLIPSHVPVTIVPHLLEFTLVLNPGAVFGMGAGRRWFFVAFTIVAVGMALSMFGAWTRRRDVFTHVSLALLLAGGLGNLYDRVIYACVRDFIHPLPGVWPYVSNLADLLLIIGVGGVMIRLWRQP